MSSTAGDSMATSLGTVRGGPPGNPARPYKADRGADPRGGSRGRIWTAVDPAVSRKVPTRSESLRVTSTSQEVAMSQRSGYEPGVPCWVDLSSTDVEASVRFYDDVFGWQAEMIDDPAAGGYGQFTYDGEKVAGVGPVMGEGMPSTWNTYIAIDDAAATADRVKNSGGTVVVEP